MFEKLTNKLQGWLDQGITLLPNLALAILCFILTIIIAKAIRKGSKKYLQKFGTDLAIASFLSRIFFIIAIAMGSMMALSVLNLDKTVTTILAGLGIVGLALGFAFQDTAANLMSGIYITFKQPLKLGDFISTSTGHEGIVKDINLRITKIQTLNGQMVHLPNRLLFQEYFINYTETQKRNLALECGISYGDDLEKVEQIALAAMENLPHRLKTEPVSMFWTGFGDSSINFQLNVWMTFANGQYDFPILRNEAIKALKIAFDKNDISIPFPIRTLDFGIKGGVELRQELHSLQAAPKN